MCIRLQTLQLIIGIICHGPKHRRALGQCLSIFGSYSETFKEWKATLFSDFDCTRKTRVWEVKDLRYVCTCTWKNREIGAILFSADWTTHRFYGPMRLEINFLKLSSNFKFNYAFCAERTIIIGCLATTCERNAQKELNFNFSLRPWFSSSMSGYFFPVKDKSR